MANLENALFSQLQTISSVTSLVRTRVYPQHQKLADKVYPAIVYHIGDTTSFSTYDGPANQLVSAVIQLACIGSTDVSASALKDALLTALDGTSGTWGGVTIQGCFLEEDGVQPDIVTAPVTEEILAYVYEVSFLVWFVNS